MQEQKTSDDIKPYFTQIKKTPLLTFEEELELSRRIKKGDEAAKTRLIEANLRLVVKIARSYLRPDVSFSDLIQEGNLGLIIAAGKYDYAKKVRFSTYAAWWIRQAVLRYLSNKKRSIRLPYRKESTISRIKQTFYTLNQQYERRPSLSEVADSMSLKEKQVVELLSLGNEVVSLDTELKDDSSNLLDFYEDYTYHPSRDVMAESLRKDTLRFLNHLPEKEKKILMYRYSFINGRRYTLKAIGQKMGLSPETVRQIEIRAIEKLREHSGEMQEYMYSPVGA
jgi:RNA polymerase primary sigma factor